MDVSDITPQVKELDEELNKLQEVLKPLMEDLSVLSSKVPLLNKAKLCVLTSYAIESLLFSSLRLNGVDVKNHAVFTELTRVKQYFEKIQKLETPPEPPAERKNNLNTEAAIRFVRSDLADNKDVNEKLTQQIVKERAKAAAKVVDFQKKRNADEAVGAPAQGNGKPAKKSKKSKK